MRQAVAMIMLLATLPAHAEIPEAYQMIVRRNIFDANRGRPVVTATAARVEAPPSIESVTLIGVAILGDRPTAMFAGSAPELAGTRQVGERLALGRVIAIDTGGVTLQPDAAAHFRLGVGQSLKRSAGQPWQEAAERSVHAVVGERTEAAGQDEKPAAATAEEILRRMLERRQRELKP